MKNLSLRIISIIALLALLLSMVACQPSAQLPEDTRDTKQTADPLETDSRFRFKAEYTIVRNSFYKDAAEISTATMLVKSALSKSAGLKSSYYTDIEGAEKNTVHEYEILIGYTGRESSKAAIEGLGIDDYTYIVESENVIVICGGSPKATLAAAEKFCLDILGYSADGKSSVGSRYADIGTKYEYRAQYPYEKATLGGIDIEDYKIAVPSSAEVSRACIMQEMLGSYTGYSVPIVKYSELDGKEKGVVCLGSLSRNENDGYNGRLEGGILRTSFAENGNVTVGIDFLNAKYYDVLIDDLKALMSESSSGGLMDIALLEKEIKHFDIEAAYGDIPTWTLAGETTEDIAAGVQYIERSYTDENGLPYKAYILLADPDEVSVYMGSGNDTYELAPSKKQSVLGHMKAAEANGKTVLAGVNGDFYNINSDFSPLGIAIKEGTFIHEDNDRPYCAFTKDGEFKIYVDGTAPDTDNIITAVGGSDVLIYEGLPYDTDMNQDFGYIAHPRTFVGVREDGTIIFAVVDGRQKALSNGAPLGQCAKLMMELGAEYAINLDGGGSSTMITHKDGEYDTKNSPSDGNLRAVYNSLLLVAKKK